jgi:acyl carrier protein
MGDVPDAVCAVTSIVTLAEARTTAERRRSASERLKALMVERLELPMPAWWITDDQPLFGRGLELDSLDALELAVGVEYFLDVEISDDAIGVFGSINAMVDFIEHHGITVPDELPGGDGAWDLDELEDW